MEIYRQFLIVIISIIELYHANIFSLTIQIVLWIFYRYHKSENLLAISIYYLFCINKR